MMTRHHARHAGRPLCGLLALAAVGAAAQISMQPRTMGVACGGGRTADGSTSRGGRGFYITPSVAVQATLTDNVNLSATNKQSDLMPRSRQQFKWAGNRAG